MIIYGRFVPVSFFSESVSFIFEPHLRLKITLLSRLNISLRIHPFTYTSLFAGFSMTFDSFRPDLVFSVIVFTNSLYCF